MSDDQADCIDLLQRAAAGNQASWRTLLARHENRLRRLVAFRPDRRLQGRLDTSDVLQEVYGEVTAHLADYLREPSLPFYLWLRGIAGNKLRELHRHHRGTEMRDANREVALYHGPSPRPAPPTSRTGCSSAG
jgi:RNA polymerase sigma-70 factor (ECF subfamily)